MEILNALISNDCSTDETEDDTIIQKSFFKGFSLLCLEKCINTLRAASEISDAHRCGNTITMNFAETFNLNTTG